MTRPLVFLFPVLPGTAAAGAGAGATGAAAGAVARVNERILRPPDPSTYSPPRGPR